MFFERPVKISHCDVFDDYCILMLLLMLPQKLRFEYCDRCHGFFLLLTKMMINDKKVDNQEEDADGYGDRDDDDDKGRH